ncbi:MAG: hypothetical protein EPO11_00910 [Gammaproteobacteria bacterium]|nr:MAG: hypothetical protein EPO11_00910 [Gammaproteobacteria bacterium]
MSLSKSKGFTLFVVLIFLQIFSMMGLYGLTTVALIIKMNQDEWQREVNVDNARTVLYGLTTIDGLNCFIPITSPSALAKQTMDWWQSNACSGNSAGNPYYYVVESLGKDACGVIGGQIAAYYRVSLRFGTILLQGTLAQGDEMASCDQPHHVVAGYQMWREI